MGCSQASALPTPLGGSLCGDVRVHRGRPHALAARALPGCAGTGDRAPLQRQRRPEREAQNVFALATKFYLPDGTVTDLIGITRPAFFARTPDEFLGLVTVKAPGPAGEPDTAGLQALLADHPVARWAQLMQNRTAPMSLAQTSFRLLHAYRFVNAEGFGRWTHYHWEPEAEVAGRPVENLAEQPHEFLFDEFERRLQQGPSPTGSTSSLPKRATPWMTLRPSGRTIEGALPSAGSS